MLFVSAQKANLEAAEADLEALQQEREELGKLVDADRNAVRAVLQQRTYRDMIRAWGDRAIGLVFGITSGIVASYLFQFLQSEVEPQAQDILGAVGKLLVEVLPIP